MNAAISASRESGWSHFRRELPGLVVAMVVAVVASVLWRRNGWAHADIGPFAAFSLVQTHWQFRRLIAWRPLRGIPLALGVSALMTALVYTLLRI
jgi:hypothetical protein